MLLRILLLPLALFALPFRRDRYEKKRSRRSFRKSGGYSSHRRSHNDGWCCFVCLDCDGGGGDCGCGCD